MSEANGSDPDTAADNGPAGVVLFLSGDLMFASRVRGAAEAADLGFRLAGDLPGETDSSIRHVVLDLSTRAKLISGFRERCRQACPRANVIAYGPHVQTQNLTAARGEGIEAVLTRGQFDAKLSSLFA